MVILSYSRFCVKFLVLHQIQTKMEMDRRYSLFIYEKYFMIFFLSESVVKDILQEILTSTFSCDAFIYHCSDFLIWCFLPLWTAFRQDGEWLSCRRKTEGFLKGISPCCMVCPITSALGKGSRSHKTADRRYTGS